MQKRCVRSWRSALRGRWLALTAFASLAAAPQEKPPEKPYEERVEVERVVVDAHVVDSFSVPIQGLTAVDYYVLVFRAPEGPPGEHEIHIRLADREGTVTHRRFYQDGAK